MFSQTASLVFMVIVLDKVPNKMSLCSRTKVANSTLWSLTYILGWGILIFVIFRAAESVVATKALVAADEGVVATKALIVGTEAVVDIAEDGSVV